MLAIIQAIINKIEKIIIFGSSVLSATKLKAHFPEIKNKAIRAMSITKDSIDEMELLDWRLFIFIPTPNMAVIKY